MHCPVLEAEIPARVSARSRSGETLPGWQVAVFSQCAHRAERGRGLAPSSLQTTNAIGLGPTLTTSLNFNDLLKALSPNAVGGTLGLRLQHRNFGETQFSARRGKEGCRGEGGSLWARALSVTTGKICTPRFRKVLIEEQNQMHRKDQVSGTHTQDLPTRQGLTPTLARHHLFRCPSALSEHPLRAPSPRPVCASPHEQSPHRTRNCISNLSLITVKNRCEWKWCGALDPWKLQFIFLYLKMIPALFL